MITSPTTKVIFEQEVPVRKENGDIFIFQDCTGENRIAMPTTIVAIITSENESNEITIEYRYIGKIQYYDLYINGVKNSSFIRIWLWKIDCESTASCITLDLPIKDGVVISNDLKIYVFDENVVKEKLNEQF